MIEKTRTLNGLLVALALLTVAGQSAWGQDCGCGRENPPCDGTPPCVGCVCDWEQPGCTCIANCLDPTCDVGTCQLLTCSQDGCGAGLNLPDCACGQYCSNEGGPGCGGSYPCPDPDCTEFGGPHCDCVSSCGTAPQCTGSDFCWCELGNLGCPGAGDCGLWCSNSQGPGCDSVERTCECGGADCNNYPTCDAWYCSNAADIPPQQGFQPCGGKLTCKVNGCGGTTCPDGDPAGFCDSKCGEGGQYQQPCGGTLAQCDCAFNHCPHQGGCAGPVCRSKPRDCRNKVCGARNDGGCTGYGCNCAAKCSQSLVGWDCGGFSIANKCNCRALFTACTDCGGFRCPVGGVQNCPHGTCLH